MSNLGELLKEKINNGEKAFIPYIMIGEESLDRSYEDILFFEKAGATLIELGIPFSDPTSDGKVIQESGIKALKNGVNVEKVFELIKKVREVSDIPLVIMSYINPIFKYGLEEFFKTSKEVNLQGVILPDVPIEEKAFIEEYIDKYEIAYIPLYSPTTPKSRVKDLCLNGEGFLYVVTSLGVTGEKDIDKKALEEEFNLIRKEATLPLMAGFGISSKEDVKEIIKYADGVIVGTKVIKLLRENDYNTLEDLIKASKL
ncbi:tryptophan synthase subunit alpha [Clostridium sp. YIM B02551]|uniref:tryptophan synthase subunit alpha n=1 Tax=Clostridium sp. YIM B02551 TaxID=2910679 RepID=UPI001EEC092D|nr:tryptophan synthase subunit alpha [Clostridium sp. YIM B02551]